LIPILIIVWGGIAYQILGGISKESNLTVAPINRVQDLEIDTFQYQLSLNYDDPFQVSTIKPEKTQHFSNSTNRAKTSKRNPQESIKLINWPTLKYGGVVSSSNNKKVGLLTINGNSLLVKEGENYRGVLIKEYNEKEIILEYSDEKKVLKK